jgi:hypothetical protein
MIKYLVLLMFISCSNEPKYQEGDCVVLSSNTAVKILKVTESRYHYCKFPYCYPKEFDYQIVMDFASEKISCDGLK